MDKTQGFTSTFLFSPSFCLCEVRSSTGSLTKPQWPLVAAGVFSGGGEGPSGSTEAVQCCHP